MQLFIFFVNVDRFSILCPFVKPQIKYTILYKEIFRYPDFLCFFMFNSDLNLTFNPVLVSDRCFRQKIFERRFSNLENRARRIHLFPIILHYQ